MLSTRIPLTAYDRLFLAGHLAHLHRGLPGHHFFALLDLRGPLDRARLRAAFAGALAANPLTMSRIGYSYVTARPHWRCPPDAACPPDSDALPLSYHDLREDAASAQTSREILLRAWRKPHHPSAAPQMHLFHFQFHDHAHRLVLQGPHYLMDGEGATLFLQAVGSAKDVARQPAAAQASCAGPSPSPASPDEYPPGWSRRYLHRWYQGLRAWSAQRRIPGATLKPISPVTEASADFLFRYWPAPATSEILAAARSTCSAGPMRYTRYFMMALLRSLEDLRDDLGLDGEVYVLPIPLLRPRRGPRTVLTRNDLTIATLALDRRLLSRSADLDAALKDQLDAYTRTGLDEAAWVTMTYAGWMRIRHYRRFLLRGRIAPYSAGFSNLRIKDRWSDFLGAQVEGFSACALPLIPPGTMITFSHYADRLNFSIAFFPHVCPPVMAHRLADRLVQHIGVPASSESAIRHPSLACPSS